MIRTQRSSTKDFILQLCILIQSLHNIVRMEIYMEYKALYLNELIKVESIYSVHYFEYMSNFSFGGESHDFWEILCVDKGEVHVIADDRKLSLKKGEIIFHKPNEFHNLNANGITAPNLVVVSFACHSSAMSFFEDKVLTIGETERHLLASIIKEAKLSFSTPLDDPKLMEIQRSASSIFGGEQLIKLYLEEMLIKLYRRYQISDTVAPVSKTIKIKSDSELYDKIVQYMETHIYAQLTIDQICKDNLISRSQLLKLFREKENCGIMDYFAKMKVKAAKQLIRDNHLNFTQISETLGYSSIHYFSRHFKKITGMTPSEYASSIKVMADV